TLGLRQTTGQASTRKGVPVWIGSRVTVGERLQEGNDLVLFLVRQAEIPGSHVDVVRDLGHGPTVYFFDRSFRAVPGSNVVFVFVPRVVEVDQLLQALDVAVMKELLLKVRPGCFGGRTLRWRHRHIACRRHLHLAVGTRGKLFPGRVWVGG